MAEELGHPAQPRLRGRLHLVAALLSVDGLVWLVTAAGTWQERLAAWVYGLAALLLYATSSGYHVFAKKEHTRRVMRSLDHSMIYVLIAGSFTPICVLAMTGGARWAVLLMMWSVALVGVAIALVALDRFRRLNFALYLVLGWAAVVAVPSLLEQPAKLAMMLVAGLLYTVGAVLFSLNKPRFHPGWFGYHEVWHAIGVSAGTLLFVVNLGLVSGT